MERAPSHPKGLSSSAQAIAAALALVALTLALSAFFTHRELTTALDAQTRAELETISARTAETLRTPMALRSAPLIERVADNAFTSTLVASVRVADHNGAALALRLREDPNQLAAAQTLAVSAAPKSLRTAEPVSSAREHLGWACKTPVWSTDSPARLLGYVTVAGRSEAPARLAAALPRAALTAAAVSTLLAGALAVWGASRLTRPIRRVAAAAAELQAGRAPADLPPQGPRETKRLAAAFNAMQRSLTEARADLEHQVAQRTAQLQTVNQLLEQQMLEKNDFLRAVTHDLGAPLRNIAGMAALVREEHEQDLSPEALRWLERIDANVRVETDMLTKLVELSRASQRAEHTEEVSAHTVAQELAKALEPDLQRERIELRTDPDLPTLRVDRTDLWMLLQNLADNAVKYMGDAPTRRVEITALYENDRPTGLAVTDTGPGVPLDEQPRLFRAFHRASTSAGREGAGVGLSVVKSIADRWNAKIKLISPPEGGCRFEITLPADRILTAPGVSSPAP